MCENPFQIAMLSLDEPGTYVVTAKINLHTESQPPPGTGRVYCELRAPGILDIGRISLGSFADLQMVMTGVTADLTQQENVIIACNDNGPGPGADYREIRMTAIEVSGATYTFIE